ncbi:MAG: DUF3768 domain-containing protein [Elusimicrobiota bacterium]
MEEIMNEREELLSRKQEAFFNRLPGSMFWKMLKINDDNYRKAVEFVSREMRKGEKNSMDKMQRNDLLRSKIPCVSKPDALVVTSGIYDGFSDKEVAEIMQKVKDFNEFNEGNDPWKEHDFGSFVFKERKIFWKIDDLNGEEGYGLVLTIMLAEQY